MTPAAQPQTFMKTIAVKSPTEIKYVRKPKIILQVHRKVIWIEIDFVLLLLLLRTGLLSSMDSFQYNVQQMTLYDAAPSRFKISKRFSFLKSWNFEINLRFSSSLFLLTFILILSLSLYFSRPSRCTPASLKEHFESRSLDSDFITHHVKR